MKRIWEFGRKWGKRALLGATVLAAGKSGVEVLSAQYYVGACRSGGSHCYYAWECWGDGQVQYECRCTANTCATWQIC